LGLGLGLPFAEVLGPQERRLASSIVERLEPSDPQEEMHSWKLAVTHLLAAERIGKARQPDLPDRPQQIELGLALRLMSLNQRESAALDRHREVKARAAERAEKRAEKRAAARRAAKPTPVRVTQRMTEAAPPGTYPPAPGAPREAFEAAAPRAGFEGAFEPEDQPEDQPEEQREHQPRAGFIVVPEPVSPEEWDRESRAHHARMAAGEMPSEAERAVWSARCERAMAEARARGQNGGILRVPYPSPEEMAEEVAEWAAQEAAGEAARASREPPERLDGGRQIDSEPNSRPGRAGGADAADAPPEGPPLAKAGREE
jgi:hypothetical protein